jgi:hypothetical protein
VEVGRAAVDQLLDKLGDIGAGSPLSGQVADLLLRWDLAGKEKPKKAFGKGFLAAGCLGKKLLALGDCLSTETDALFGIEDGSFPYKALDTTGTAIYLVESDLVYNLGTMLFP